MEIIEFYGRTIRVKDISFCEKRDTQASKVSRIIWNIIGSVGVAGILFWIFFYDISKEFTMGIGLDISLSDAIDINPGDFVFLLFIYMLVWAVLNGVRDFIFGRNKFVLIVLHYGEKIKSPTMSDNDASLLYIHISKILNGEKDV